tara:strand:+ start:4083 stop:4949 length:867 start_codon:yes stop_codon:yes gene_type:complete
MKNDDKLYMDKRVPNDHAKLSKENDQSESNHLNSNEGLNNDSAIIVEEKAPPKEAIIGSESQTSIKAESRINKEKVKAPSKTRKDLQLPRRAFHFSCGVGSGLIYMLFLSHQQAVYILGIATTVFYVLEQLRINYPNAIYLKQLNQYFLRAEEQLKESAAIPYLMALLLTIISFPKSIALVAIFTLATADPLSAIIGIRFGKRRLVKEKSIEGSLAFFVASFVVTFSILFAIPGNQLWSVLAVTFLSSTFITAFEMIPIKLDDNLTIPLMKAIILWIITSYVGLNVGG